MGIVFVTLFLILCIYVLIKVSIKNMDKNDDEVNIVINIRDHETEEGLSSELSSIQKKITQILPKDVAEYFIISKIDLLADTILIHIEEKNILQDPNNNHEYTPIGFYETPPFKDFPINNDKVTLSIKRRKWRDKTTGAEVSNKYKIVEEEGKYSKEITALLNRALRQIPAEPHGLK
jgi:predicted metal-dependent hydrolase